MKGINIDIQCRLDILGFRANLTFVHSLNNLGFGNAYLFGMVIICDQFSQFLFSQLSKSCLFNRLKVGDVGVTVNLIDTITNKGGYYILPEC